MGRVVIVAFRPKQRQEGRLLELVRGHAPRLRELGLATDREATIMRAADGTLVEVFEWREGAIERAHEHPEVLAMWAEFDRACDYVPLREMAESANLFAEFEPVS